MENSVSVNCDAGGAFAESDAPEALSSENNWKPDTSTPVATFSSPLVKNKKYYVNIPRSVRPGQRFAVLVNGQLVMVRCPEDKKPGERLLVSVPKTQANQYFATIPANVKPSQQFPVMIKNQEVIVTCPCDCGPGQRITFQLPIVARPRPSPNHQLCEFIIPEGARPGQSFPLTIGKQKVTLTCPPNVRPGKKIYFQLPNPSNNLSEEQPQEQPLKLPLMLKKKQHLQLRP